MGSNTRLALFLEGPVAYKVGRDKRVRFDFVKLGEKLASVLEADSHELRYYNVQPSDGISPGFEKFLQGLDQQPNVRVIQPRAKPLKIRCPNCNHDHSYDDLTVHWEMIRDMQQGAFEEAYDIGVVVSGRMEFVPTLQLLNSLQGLRMMTAFWSGSRLLQRELRNAVEFIDMERWGDITLNRATSSRVKPRW